MKKRACTPQEIRSLGLLALCLTLALMLGSCRAETPPVIGDTPMVVTEAPTVGAEPLAYPPPPTDTPAGYPPPGGPFIPPTPRPTFTPLPPTPTPWSIADLPPLPTYAPPGLFNEFRLLFSDHLSSGLFTIKTDGTDKIQFPNWPEDQRNGQPTRTLRVAPDGCKILYTLQNTMDMTIASIWIMDPDGSNKKLLVNRTAEWVPLDAIWSPDGQEIAYRRGFPSSTGYASQQLWIMDADGSDSRLVLDDPAMTRVEGGTVAIFFRWMCNGYIYFANHDEQLYAVNPLDGDLYLLMEHVDPLALRQAVSPDGQHVKVSQEISDTSIQQAGMIPVQLPVVAWSNDGTQFVYHLDEDGMWLQDLTTGEVRLLLPPTLDHLVRIHGFSPDNQLIVYQTDEGIHVLDLLVEDGSHRLILHDPLDPEAGIWTLDFLGWIPIP